MHLLSYKKRIVKKNLKIKLNNRKKVKTKLESNRRKRYEYQEIER